MLANWSRLRISPSGRPVSLAEQPTPEEFALAAPAGQPAARASAAERQLPVFARPGVKLPEVPAFTRQPAERPV